MLLVGLALRMAIRAREHRKVRRIGMTRRTHATGSAVICWEPGVIEHCSQPRRSVVARLASGRETGCDMVRIGRALIIRPVTAVAICGQSRIVVVHVTTGAS